MQVTTEFAHGVRLGSLVLIRQLDPIIKKNGRRLVCWECRCDCCGNISAIPSFKLKNRLQRCEDCVPKKAKKKKIKQDSYERHGQSSSPTYNSYAAMIKRCLDPSHEHYAYYGGNGIMVCDRWMKSFSNFLNDMGERPPGLTLDRIDNALGYSPDNCQWSSLIQQNRNRCNVKKYDIEGKIETLPSLIEEKNNYYKNIGSDIRIYYSLVYNRVSAGWDVLKAINTPPDITRSRKQNRKNLLPPIQLSLPIFV